MGVHLTQDIIDAAKATESKYGVPASVTLAQVMLESGGTNPGGLSGLAYKYNNYFGVTAGPSWDGKTVTMTNKAGNDTKTYRVYDSIVDSFNDHAKVLQNDRYTQYTKTARTAEDYVDGVAKGGYAEDKNYASKLKNLIKTNNLTQYDGNFSTVKPTVDGNFSAVKPAVEGDKPSEDDSSSPDLKWWGDIVVLIITILVAGLGILFFVSAFGKSPVSAVKNAAGKIKGG